jgi:16S rRNA C1402 (ribose-2'-O) methylase RsmI
MWENIQSKVVGGVSCFNLNLFLSKGSFSKNDFCFKAYWPATKDVEERLGQYFV